MQWLIDMILGMVAALGYLTTAFVDRGDPGSSDFPLGDLTLDNAWHDLDLAPIVPANVKSVLLRISVQDDLVTSIGRLRKKGHTHWPNTAECRLNVSNITIAYDKIVALDSDRKCEYRFTATTWTWISITVAGWWL